jgi:hypothetical protein
MSQPQEVKVHCDIQKKNRRARSLVQHGYTSLTQEAETRRLQAQMRPYFEKKERKEGYTHPG